MTQKINKPIVITCSTTTTSSWFGLDWKYGENQSRPMFIQMAAASNAVWVQVADADETHIHTVSVFAGTDATSVATMLNGNWPKVRFQFIGTGQSKIVLFG